MADAAETLDDPPTLYEQDFYLWCFRQAELLRLRRFQEADLPNIIEELETLGRSDRRAYESSFRLLIAHLLKWQYQPQMRSRSWEVTIVRERANIESTETGNKSLKAEARQIVQDVYRKARREAKAETDLPLSVFPAECPYTLDQLRDDEWMPG